MTPKTTESSNERQPEGESQPFARDFEEPWNLLHIDLDRLLSNYALLRARIPSHRALYAVVKSNAYGHGLEATGKALADAGCRHFAVESPQEGILLRQQGIDGEILLLNPIPAWMAETSVHYDLSVSVIHSSILEPLQNACELLEKQARVHLNVNVGLHRMGIAPSKLLSVARRLERIPELKLEGLMAQPRDPQSALVGFGRLKELASSLQSQGIDFARLHFANSTVFMTHPETSTEGARLGILLYGVLPPEQYDSVERPPELEPVMSLTTRVVQVRELGQGSRIGYRGRTRTKRDSLIGTIPMGYSHGLDRGLARSGQVLIRGQRVSFLGPISMNSATIDLTDVAGGAVGDVVTVLGRDGDEQIVANELAAQSGTIAADVLVRFGNGTARRFLSNGADAKIRRLSEIGEREDVEIRTFFSERELPEEINVHQIAQFIESNVEHGSDSIDVIRQALDYSLSLLHDGDGFVALAMAGDEIVGSLVCARTGTSGFIPENIIVYHGVAPRWRHRGILESLLSRAFQCTDGDFKLHVDRFGPAIKFYESKGFQIEGLELRRRQVDT